MYNLEFVIAGIKLKCRIKATSRQEAIDKLKNTLKITKVECEDKDWSEVENIFDQFNDIFKGKK